MLTAELTGRNPGFSLAENTDDLFVGKTLLHGDVLMWLMKTLLTSGCVNQRGAGQPLYEQFTMKDFSSCKTIHYCSLSYKDNINQ
ncbi:hypothetical protein BVG90_21655 [Serratia marcescens]|nr:hypothetical protein BVG90_21655 [Serratia marcescens]